MSNKENKINRSLLDTQRGDSNAAYKSYMQGANQDLTNARSNSAALRSQIHDKYSNSNNFMPEGMRPNASGWFDMPDNGGGGDFSGASAGYNELARTGGVNREDFNPALDSYKGFMSHGGVDATALRQRATAQIPAFYQAYKNNAARRANVQGGYSPGFDSQMAELGREQGRAGFEASRQVEGDIAEMTQKGKMFGTSGYGNLMGNITGMEQQGKIAGLGGLTTIGGYGESRAARNQQMQLALQEMYQRGGMESGRGLQNLYSSRSGEMDQGIEGWLRGRGQMDENELRNIAIRSGIHGKDWMKMFSQIASMGGTGVSAYDTIRDRNNKAESEKYNDPIYSGGYI